MIRFLLGLAVWLVSAAAGLLVATYLLDGMNLTTSGFVTVVVVFAAAQSILAPFVAMLAKRYAPPVLGGIGLVTTVVALLITSFVTDGLTIDGFDTWVFASLIVWITTMIATLLLPVIVVKRVLDKRTPGRENTGPGTPASA
ncbi:phage holin family protein [Pengzhenrongella sicca]|uniref:Phage holin family protein n=1 Tax=Pengzhenrongella sicca TaxID=2819238 RepID=A0A8A4ZDR8_9MICO|nr:phage holin family protein [Pengzhenrongella sicca]QTE29551.1 phage holin family protein [Pengzhenrongella sicca]